MSANVTPSHRFIAGSAIACTIWLASAMTTTSIVFVPALLRTVSSPKLRSSKLEDDPGFMTPHIETSSDDSVSGLVSSTTAPRHVAQQFARFDSLAFRTQVPLEILMAVTYGYLAYAHRRGTSATSAIQSPYAISAILLMGVFPFTGGLMVPYVHKISRVARREDELEASENPPPVGEADVMDIAGFLSQWSVLNGVRSVMVVVAAGVAGWAVTQSA